MKRLKQIIKRVIAFIKVKRSWSKLFEGEKKLVVLMYHRILPEDDARYHEEEPGMVVTPESLELHIKTLQDAEIPITTIESWLATPDELKPQVAAVFTFDDGWIDNFEYAFPLFQKHNETSTLYVISDALDGQADFWPNRVLSLLMTPNDFKQPQFGEFVRLLGHIPTQPMDRDAAAEEVRKLKQFSDSEIITALSCTESHYVSSSMMNLEQIKLVSDTMGVNIGCHSKSHSRLLAGMDTESLLQEVRLSKDILQSALDKDILGFCYPNGDYTPEALMLTSQHYQYAVTTNNGINRAKNDNLHELKRVAIHNDGAYTKSMFKAKLVDAL